MVFKRTKKNFDAFYKFYLTRTPIYEDSNEYFRNVRTNRLVHREIAFESLYDDKKFPKSFSAYAVHHKDFNRWNNHPYNLQILTKEEHDAIHDAITHSAMVRRRNKGFATYGRYTEIMIITDKKHFKSG